MSSNKWKAWPMQNSEVVLKIDKMLMTTKRGSCDQFLAKIKFPEPDKMGDERIQIFFLIDFDIWNVEFWVRMRKLDQFWKLTLNKRTKREQCAQKLLRRLWIDANSEDKCNKLDGVD